MTASHRSVTVITWHYVRDGAEQALHARTIAEFENQLDHIEARFTPVTAEDLSNAARSPDAGLPENACLLTFDDGYREHFEIVFPRLAARGWSGLFFASVRSAQDRLVLDVNRIQFALAAAGLDRVIRETRAAIAAARDEFGLEDPDTLYDRLARPGLHNPPEAMFVKRALQTDLPEPLRERICADLFARHVSADEQDFAAALYAGPDELRTMHEGGMTIGGHGDGHLRLDSLDRKDRHRELERSREFLETLGVKTGNGWTFCYPYGAHDAATIEAVRTVGGTLAFTLEPRRADLDRDDALALPRIDTNDLPH